VTGTLPRRWTAWGTIWLALAAASTAPVVVLLVLTEAGARNAVSSALGDHLVAEAALAGEHLREVPVDVLVELGAGHATEAVGGELERLLLASGLHDLALIGPGQGVLGSGGSWLPLAADRDLVERARAGQPVVGPLYRGEDEALYLAAYVPLAGRPGWVVAVEGSARLEAVDQLARRHAMVGVLLVLAVTGLGVLLATLVSRPLRTLEAELLQVTPGDPPEKVLPSGPREVYRVAWAVRTLLAAIRERDQEVEAAHRRQVEQLTRVAATIAHEVRNPLNAMSLSTGRLARADEPDKRRVLAERLASQIQDLEAIVDRLLHLTRPVSVRRERVELLALAQRIAGEGALPVQVDGSPASCTTDPTLVGEVLRNLLLNAEQAGASRVRLSLLPAASGWHLEVEDDGHGVSEPDRIFEWFHTSRARGSGLGLPLSRRIAESLGGRLLLVSARPARFRLEVP
jgi:signal transduction histidine kinase